MRKIFLVVLFLLACAPRGHTQSCTTATCTAAGVSTAQVLAALPAPGNTNATVVVNIPAGTSNWTSSIPSYSVPAAVTSLTIQGATTCTGSGDPAQNNLACTDNTIIQDNDTVDSNVLFGIATAGFLRVTGITFQYGTGAVKNSGMLNPSAGNQVRIDHVHFNTDTGTSASDLVDVTGCTTGVVDHVLVTNTTNKRTGNSIVAWNGVGCGGTNESAGNFGDFVWSQPTGFGTSNFIFVEQSTVQGGPSAAPANSEVNDCLRGGRIVWRFNTATNGAHLQTHPTGSANSQRGCRAYEAYGNSWFWTLPPVSGTQNSVATIFFFSSGPAIMWGNTFGTASAFGWANIVAFNGCRDSQGACGYNQQPGGTGGWGNCNGASVWDGNTGNGSNAGYACADQPTRGQGDLLAGQIQNNNKTNTAFSAPHYPRQASEPLYYWLNAYHQLGSGNNTCPSPVCANSDVTQNVDYYLSSDPTSGTDCAGFTGATGVGCGARSARPTSCTTGVAWWSTDQGSWNQSGNGFGNGVLDKCTATNTWTNATYTPYTYPNPLESGGGGNPPAVAPACIPLAGTYQAWTNVSCTTPSGTLMCYTTDGSTPVTNGATGCTHGTQYATTPVGAPNPINVSTNQTVQIVAGGTGFTDSPVTSQAYVINGDQYGGRLDIPCTNTSGVFQMQQIGNRWFFCTPQGHAFISMQLGMGLNSNLLDCNNVQQGTNNYLRLYGDATFNWGWQQTAKAVHWGFNSVGESSVSFVQGSTTCPSCVWPGHKQPFHLPYVFEGKPAENAAQNLSNIGTGPIKDSIVATNTHWQGYRGRAQFDVFDPGLAGTWAAELASSANAAVKNNDPNILYVLTDDSDFFEGSGASPDFVLHTPGATTAGNPAWATLLTSPVQTATAITNVGAKTLLYSVIQNYSKAQALNPVTTCGIANPCSLRDYLKQKYTTIGALNTAWGSTYTTFDSSATVVTNEAFGTGDGTTTTFTHTTANGNIDPFSVSVSTAGVLQMGDCPWVHVFAPTYCLVAQTATNTGTLLTPPAGNTATLENHSVPAAGNPLMVTVTHGAFFDANVSVKYHATGTSLTSVAGTPTTGQYNAGTTANGGVYTFSVGDAGVSLDFTYTFELINQATTTINYATGAVTLNFIVPPANGAAITISYQSNGWMQGGTGLMDEDGTNTAWVGTNTWCLQGPDPLFPTYSTCFNGSGGLGVANANPNLGADLNTWVSQYSAQYFQTMRNGLTAAGSRLPYFGLDVVGGYGAPAFSKFLQGETPYVDGIFNGAFQLLESPTLAEYNARLQYHTFYSGNKPFAMFKVSGANQDSAYSCKAPGGINYATQPARGQGWFNDINTLLNTPGANGTIQWVGTIWWVIQDFQNINQGLTTPLGNAYDGVESVVGNVPCDNYYAVLPGATCGGEVAAFNAPYGDVITGVTAGNRLWLGALTGSVSVSPSSENFGTINVGSSGTPQVATVTNFTTSSTSIVSTAVLPATGTPAGNFAITANTCTNGLVLAAGGGSCTVTTNYFPSITGAESATLNVTITGGTVLPVAMSGTGASTSNPVAAFAPLALPIGNVVVNQSQNGNVVLTSAGTSPLLISNISTTGVGFSQTNNCPASLASNLSCTIQVTFMPTTTGTFSGSLVFIDNAPGSPQAVPLSGSGILVPTTSTGVTIQGSVVQ